jgi:hypothetical protein
MWLANAVFAVINAVLAAALLAIGRSDGYLCLACAAVCAIAASVTHPDHPGR